MLRRFILLVFVAGLSGTVGLWVGLFYAPAPGEDTRQKLSTFFPRTKGRSTTSSRAVARRWATPSMQSVGR